MFGSIKEKAKLISGNAYQKKDELFSSGTKKSQELFNENYPKIESVVIDGFLGVAENKLSDEEFISDCFEKAYEILPIPVRLIISRKYFIELLLKHKDPLLVKVANARNQRKSNLTICTDVEANK